MKVLHLIETAEPGGAETVFVELASRMRRGVESVGGVMEEGWASRALVARKIPVHVLPLRRSFDFGWVARLGRLIRQERVDLIHAHEFSMNCYATLAARIANVPVICTVHGKNYYPDRYYRRAAYRWVARRADAYVAVSEDLKRFLVRKIGIPSRRVITILNGVDMAGFGSPRQSRDQVRLRLDIPPSAFVVLTVAALFGVKGHKDLLKAAAGFVRHQHDAVFLLAGEGPLESDIRSLVEKLGLTGRVRLLGFRNDVPDLLAASDLFVLPSYSEGLPLSVIEAMAARVPVVATNVGGVGEAVVDGRTGLLIPPMVPEALVEAMLKLCRDGKLRSSLADAGFARVKQEFSIEGMVGAYDALYQRVLGAYVRRQETI